MTNKSLTPVSPPSLSPDLTRLYNSLNIEQQGIFIKVFKYLWGVVLPYKSFSGPSGALRSFWAVDIVLRRYDMKQYLYSLLTFLYYLSRQGVRYIHSDMIYNNTEILPGVGRYSRNTYLSRLVQLGYITRGYINPDATYKKIRFNSRAVFIRLTPSGLAVIADIEKDLYKLLLNVSLNDMIGVNKKPG